MKLSEKEYNSRIREFLAKNPKARETFIRTFLRMPAVIQMLSYFYRAARVKTVTRSTVYADFFKTPFVTQFCDQEGIEPATDEASRHRCPFLINVLDACALVSQHNDQITVDKLLLVAPTVKVDPAEKLEEAQQRAKRAWNAVKGAITLPGEDVSLLREAFGKDFLTDKYHLKDSEYLEL
jgi:hypothetical protein